MNLFKKLSVLTVVILLFSLPSIASASSVFVGGTSGTYPITPIQTVQGAEVTITTPSIFPTLTSGQVTSVWSMVANASTGALAQMGFASEPAVSSINPHYFYGDINTSGTYFEYDSTSGPATSSTQNYVIEKVSGNWVGYLGVFQFYSSAVTVTPNEVQFFNETDPSAVKYYGTSTSKIKMASAQYLDGSASASNPSLWVWTKPALSFSNASGSSIDNSTWSGSSYWLSWTT